MSTDKQHPAQVTTTGRTAQGEPDQTQTSAQPHAQTSGSANSGQPAGTLPDALNPGSHNPGPHNPDPHGVPGATHETSASKLEDEAASGTENRY